MGVFAHQTLTINETELLKALTETNQIIHMLGIIKRDNVATFAIVL
jgi:hypothetical protein